jgi:ABC-2 type transport system permease protein
MAIVLLRLKLTLQRRALGRGGTTQRLLFVGAWLLALVLGLATAATVGFLDSSRSGLGDLALLIILTVIFIGWVLLPIVMPVAQDQTLNPALLEQYPISPRDQVLGLLLGGLVSPMALFTFLTAAGGTLVAGERVTARVAVLLAALVFVVLCVAASRATSAALAGLLQTRRGRDLAIAVAGVLSLSIYLLSQSAHNLTNVLADLEHSSAELVLSWLPPGAIGAGMIAVRDGDWTTALMRLAIALVGIGIALAVWAWALRRRVHVGGSERRTNSKPAADSNLIPFPISAVSASAASSAAAQQWRYYFFRSPRAIQSALFPLLVGVVAAHSFVSDGGIALGAVILVVLGVSAGFNVFAFDGPGFGYLTMAGAPMRSVLAGKASVTPIFLIPVLAVFVIVEALLMDAWTDAFPAFLAGVGVAFVAAGLGAITSVHMPVAMTTASGADRAKAMVGTLVAFLVLALLVAAGAGAWISLQEVLPASIAILPLVALAVLLGWWLTSLAGNRLQRDQTHVAERLGV